MRNRQRKECSTNQITLSDLFYLHLDNLGSPAVVTGNSGNVQKQYRYYAFGNLRSQSGSFNTDYSFTGYLKEETGTHYAKMRYYEGGIGRFLRVDPLGALNPYVYCENDPLNFVDPWGLELTPGSSLEYLGGDIYNTLNWILHDPNIGIEVKGKRYVGPWTSVDNYHPFDDCLQITLTDDICRQEEGEFHGLPAQNNGFPVIVKGTVGKRGGNRSSGEKPADKDKNVFDFGIAANLFLDAIDMASGNPGASALTMVLRPVIAMVDGNVTDAEAFRIGGAGCGVILGTIAIGTGIALGTGGIELGGMLIIGYVASFPTTGVVFFHHQANKAEAEGR